MDWSRSHVATLERSLTRTLDGAIAVLFAPACAACERPLDAPTEGPVCRQCWTSIAATVPATLPAAGAIDRGIAAGAYDGALRNILHALKYEGRSSLARPLAAFAREAGADILHGCSCAVPVPLHPWRRMTRGFNQAAEIARGLGLPVVDALRRTRATSPQTELDAAARRRNVAGAFAPSPWLTLLPGRTRLIEDAAVVLVDDVHTTGATLDACATVLKTAGAREVRALTIARAALPQR